MLLDQTTNLSLIENTWKKCVVQAAMSFDIVATIWVPTIAYAAAMSPS